MSERASTRVGTSPEILRSILPFIDYPLYPLLFISKSFTAATLPRLYRTLSVDLDKSDVTPFSYSSTTARHGCSDHDEGHNRDGDLEPPEWSKLHALRFCTTLRIHNHGTKQCPAADTLPPLPNLMHLDLAGGDIHPVMDPLCPHDGCNLITRYIDQIRTLTIRKLHVDLPVFLNLQHVILKIRPCGLPFFRGSREPPSTLPETASSFVPLRNARKMDVIWWDEKHDHFQNYKYNIPPWVHPKPPDKPMLWRGGGPRDKSLDCNYCNQVGCLRYSPNAPKQLPAMMYGIGRSMGNIGLVRIWNCEKTVEMYQWYDSKMSVDDVKVEMMRELVRGAGKRKGQGRDGVNIEFASAEEYVAAVSGGQLGLVRDDWEEEREYWEGVVAERAGKGAECEVEMGSEPQVDGEAE